MKLKLTLLILTIFSLFSCSDNDDSIIETNEVNIRLANNSEFKFKDATYNGINYRDIEPGEKTEYQLLENQFPYGSVNITINGEEYGWQPIDFVGESLLENGDYTFEYNFDSEEQILTDELIRD